jgi:lipoyl(octanoyl) transferase
MFIYQDLKHIDYAEALAIQTAAFDELLALKERGERGVSRLFFCEHNPVLTLGKHGLDANLLVSQDLLRRRGVAFYHTNRGGDITYHGPGQITGYPVFDLEPLHLGLRTYIEALEETVIRFLARFDLRAERMSGATGVWLDVGKTRARKICAIGVRSRRFVTMHGFALNISTDLSYFSLIHPCGFVDKGVTSLAAELAPAESPDMETAKLLLLEDFRTVFGGQ